LNPEPGFRSPSFSLFTRDPAAAVYGTCDLCAAGILPNTPTTQARLRLSLCSLGQRRSVGDYLVEQEQREGDEKHGRYGYYRQPLAFEFDLIRQCPPVEHDEHRRVEGHHKPPPEEAMINKTTGSMPVRMMTEPMVIILHTTVR
jgi:hypothetical protein